jgi:tRNA 2-thiouridine synthesizing protein A
LVAAESRPTLTLDNASQSRNSKDSLVSNRRRDAGSGSTAGNARPSLASQQAANARANGPARTNPAACDACKETVMNFDKELDARGLSCPLPILKTKKSLAEIASGQVLKVVATDPGSIKDMQAFANQTGNELLSSSEENKTYIFYMKKK